MNTLPDYEQIATDAGWWQNEGGFWTRAADEGADPVWLDSAAEACAYDGLPHDPHEDEPDYDDGPGTWMHVYGHRLADGQIRARFSTNDNLDRGYPTEFAEWESTMPEAEFRKRYNSRTGCMGMEVEVYLDGEKI